MIRRFATRGLLVRNRWSQSPDGDFFDPESSLIGSVAIWIGKSQSPDGDFFDPEAFGDNAHLRARHSSQSPDGDFFDPEIVSGFWN